MLQRARSVRGSERRTYEPREPTRGDKNHPNIPVHGSNAPSPPMRDSVPSILQPSNLPALLQRHEQNEGKSRTPELDAPLQRSRTTVHRPSVGGAQGDEWRRKEILLPPAELNSSPSHKRVEGLGLRTAPAENSPSSSGSPKTDKWSPPSVVRSRSFRSYFHRIGRRRQQETPRGDAPAPETSGNTALFSPQGGPPYDVSNEELSTVLMQGSRAVQRRQHASSRSISSPVQNTTRPQHQHSASAVGTSYTSPFRRREQEHAQLPPFTFPLPQAPFAGSTADPCSTPPSLASSSSTLASDVRVTPRSSTSTNEAQPSNEQMSQLKRALELSPPHEAHSPAPAIVLPGMQRLTPPRRPADDTAPVHDLPRELPTELERDRASSRRSTYSVRDAAPLFHHVGAERGLVYEHPDAFYEPDALRSQRASIETVVSSDQQFMTL